MSKSNAQMAAASMFADVKSDNPAVIGGRTSEVITAVGSADLIKKEQALDTSTGSPVTGQAETEIDVKTASLFRGGKGGGLTSEVSVDYNIGSKTDRLTSTTETQSTKTDASNTFAYLGLGFLQNFGISYTHTTYKNASNFSGTFAGQSYSTDFSSSVVAQGVKAGFAKKFSTIDAGVFIQRRFDNIQNTTSGAEDPEKREEGVAGAALGVSSRDFHVEVGYEKGLESRTDDFLGRTLNPARITGTIEIRAGKFLLGYTGRHYTDGFFEIERVIYNQFVYANSYAEPRLDNTFNFSFGSDKGSVLSGSVFYSALQTEEVSVFFPSGRKVATKTTAMGASIKYSYAF